MNRADTFQANPLFIAREVAGEFILIPSGKAAEKFNGLASLNGTGKFLWQKLQNKIRFGELCDIFAKEYELTEEQSRADVEDFLNMALTKALVIKK